MSVEEAPSKETATRSVTVRGTAATWTAGIGFQLTCSDADPATWTCVARPGRALPWPPPRKRGSFDRSVLPLSCISSGSLQVAVPRGAECQRHNGRWRLFSVLGFSPRSFQIISTNYYAAGKSSRSSPRRCSMQGTPDLLLSEWVSARTWRKIRPAASNNSSKSVGPLFTLPGRNSRLFPGLFKLWCDLHPLQAWFVYIKPGLDWFELSFNPYGNPCPQNIHTYFFSFG
jgi:hypothetical protein